MCCFLFCILWQHFLPCFNKWAVLLGFQISILIAGDILFYASHFLGVVLLLFCVNLAFCAKEKRTNREQPYGKSTQPLCNFLVGRMAVVPVKIMIHKNLFSVFYTYVINMDLFKFSIPHIQLNGGQKVPNLLLFLKMRRNNTRKNNVPN